MDSVIAGIGMARSREWPRHDCFRGRNEHENCVHRMHGLHRDLRWRCALHWTPEEIGERANYKQRECSPATDRASAGEAPQAVLEVRTRTKVWKEITMKVELRERKKVSIRDIDAGAVFTPASGEFKDNHLLKLDIEKAIDGNAVDLVTGKIVTVRDECYAMDATMVVQS